MFFKNIFLRGTLYSLTILLSFNVPAFCENFASNFTFGDMDSPESMPCTTQYFNVTDSVICGSWYYFPDGDSAMESTIDTSYFTDNNGCDSLIIVNLKKFFPRITSFENSESCLYFSFQKATVIVRANADYGKVYWFLNRPWYSWDSLLLDSGTFFTDTFDINYQGDKYYAAASTGKNCFSSPVGVHARAKWPPDVTIQGKDRCGPGDVNLSVDTNTYTCNCPNLKVYWLAYGTGNYTPIDSGLHYTAKSVSTDTSMGYRAIHGECPDYSSSTLININLKNKPIFVSKFDTSVCDSGNVTLKAVFDIGQVKWYNSVSDTTVIKSGSNFILGNIYNTRKVWAEGTTGECTSDTREPVIAKVIKTPGLDSILDGSTCDTGFVVLRAHSDSGTINWYNLVTDTMSFYSGNSWVTPFLNSSKKYYLEAVNGICVSSRDSIYANVYATPSLLSGTGFDCDSGQVNIYANITKGDSILWYPSFSGGIPFDTSLNGAFVSTPFITSSTNFYAEGVNHGCISGRIPVFAEIRATPSIDSTLDTGQCGAGSLGIWAWSQGDSIFWYDSLIGGMKIGSGNRYQTPVINSSRSYFVSAYSNGCESDRNNVPVNIFYPSKIDSIVQDYLCNTNASRKASVSAYAPSGSIEWYNEPTGGNLLHVGNTYTTSNNIINTTNFYAQVRNAQGCASPVRDTISAIVYDMRSIINVTACKKYVSPSGKFKYFVSGSYVDILDDIIKEGGIVCDSQIRIGLTIENVDTTVIKEGHILKSNAYGGTYKWWNCTTEKLVSGQFSQTFDASQGGEFRVIVTKNGCTDTSNCISVGPLGIKQSNSSTALKFYPNPNNGNFFVESSEEGSLMIYGIEGKLLLQKQISVGLNQLQLKHAPGTYFISIQTESQLLRERMVLK